MAQYEVEGPDGSRYIVESSDEPGVLRQAGTAAKQFGANVITGFGKMASEAPKVVDMLTTPPWAPLGSMPWGKELERTSDISKSFFDRFGKEQGSGPGFSQSIGESIGGGLAAGGITPAAVVAAAGSGAGSEGAARMFGDNFFTRLGGALVGGGLTSAGMGAVARRTPNAEALAREALQGISPQQLDQAAAFQAAQRAKGIDIDLAQALEAVGAPSSNITTIRNFLANKPQGDRVQTTLRNQPGQLSMEADQAVARMPGENYGFLQTANNITEAATNEIRRVKAARTAAVQPFYGAAGTLAPAQVKQIEDAVRKFVAQNGVRTEVASSAGDFLDKLRGGQNALAARVDAARVAADSATDAVERLAARKALATAKDELDKAKNKPISALDVDTWIGEMVEGYKRKMQQPNAPKPKLDGQMLALTGEVNKVFAGLSPEIRRGRELYGQLSDTLVNPTKQSGTGLIAGTGYRADVQSRMTAFEQLLARGSDSQAKVSDIRTAGEQLARTDPNAFADALKTYISRRIRSAMEPGATSATAANNPDMAARIAKNLWGSELQAQGLRDALEVAARSQGQDPVAAVRGLNNLMQLTRAMQSRPAQVGGLMPEDIFRISGRNVGADTLRIWGFLPFERTARRVEDAVMGKTLEVFDKILTTPDGMKLLVDLGKESVMSRKIPVLLGQFGAQFATNPAGIMGE